MLRKLLLKVINRILKKDNDFSRDIIGNIIHILGECPFFCDCGEEYMQDAGESYYEGRYDAYD